MGLFKIIACLCLSQQQHRLGRESNASRILSTRRFHDIFLQKPHRLSCMLDQHAYRCLLLYIPPSTRSPVSATRESTHLPHAFVCRSNKARKHFSPNTCRSSGPLAFKPSAGPGQASPLPSLHVEAIDWFLGDGDPSEPANRIWCHL